MFPDNWPQTILALLIVLAAGAWLRYYRNRGSEDENDTIDYSGSSTEPGPPKSKSLPEGFGTAKNHPHHRT